LGLVGSVVGAGCLLAGAACVEAQFAPAPGTGPGLPETIEAIDSARVTTRILYITAHPDDESSSVLTYLARGLHAEVALLSLTRGEGGQNALGPEQAPQLGLIRTQELLAATRGYGVKLFFTRAKDFGYSKTAEESEKIWGDQVVEDMVRVIREFRPNIVINNWGGVHGGHGHHQAAGLLTPKAVQLATDKSAYPSQIAEGLAVWGGADNSIVILDLERGSEKPSGYILPLDDVSPLWGNTWRDIGIDAFANHRTQGITAFLSSPFIRRPISLKREDGGTFDPAILAQPLHTLAGDGEGDGCTKLAVFCPLLKEAEGYLDSARTESLDLDWKNAANDLAHAAKQVHSVYDHGHWRGGEPLLVGVDRVVAKVEHALALAAGLEVKAEADRANVVDGEAFQVTARAHCRKEVQCSFGELKLVSPQAATEIKREGDADKGFQITEILGALPSSQTRDSTSEVVLFDPNYRPWSAYLPESPALFAASQKVMIASYALEVREPVTRIEATSTRADRVLVRIVPAYTLEMQPKQAIDVLAKKTEPLDVLLKVHSYATKAATVSVGLHVPAGWAAGTQQEVSFDGNGDRYLKTSVTPPKQLAAGNYTITAYAKRGEEKFATSLEPLPSLPTQLWEEPAQCVVHAFDITVPANLRVGYIAAEGEPIPESLRMLEIRVDLLDAQALAFRDLSGFDAIVTGNRAYELRSDLRSANQRLLDYVSNGGTLVVQYNTANNWDTHQYAPYPAKIGNPTPRITDEESPVKFLKPDDPLLNRPNKITQADFAGWVQERGLYFWKDFDAKYTPLLAMNDPGEPDLNGGLVYTKYGKGTYIYTGVAFFRQLPEGVPGAYRLFVNLISASRVNR
jgi:LmbE family N-acetylglucosaminyl deacetylase